jgi:2-polyprenyl-6-methoxyphenol hydroxylase-like FAD-dependent oxidoreductase
MGLVDELRAVRYPIDAVEFVDRSGTPYIHVPIERMREALDDKYVYLRRQDLEGILSRRARDAGIEVRYGTWLAALKDNGDAVEARYENGGTETFSLAIGADGVHSRVRELIFGAQDQFTRFLGLHVAAFHVPRGAMPVVRAARIYEETNRLVMTYPLDDARLDATFVVRHADMHLPRGERLSFLRDAFRGSGWIVEDLLAAHDGDEPIYFDSATQVEMPQWHRGRVALIGDACGCLTLIAAQGSHMAMAGGFVLARELARQNDHRAAFAAYQKLLKPSVDRKRRDAARFARIFVPTPNSWPWLRRLGLRLLFSRPLLRYGLAAFGVKSVLPRG